MKNSNILSEFELLKGEKIVYIEISKIPCCELSNESYFHPSPLVSVVVITYNHEDFINKCIDSILNQKTSFHFELIIAEDYSTDQTRKILFEYQSKYPAIIRVLFSDSNVGITKNAIRADLRTRGKYIAYCEGDDYWIDPEKLQKQVTIMESDPEIGMIYTGSKEYLYETDRFVDVKQKMALPSGIHQINEYFTKRISSAISITTCTVMVRQKNIIKAIKNNIVFKVNSSMMDTPRWFAASLNMKTYYMDSITGVYVIHDSSVSNTWDMKKVARQGCVVLYGFTYAIQTSEIKVQVESKVFYRMISHAFYNNDKDLAIACKSLAKRRNVKLTYLSKVKLSAIKLPFIYDILSFVLYGKKI